MPLPLPPLIQEVLKVRLLQILDAFSPHVNATLRRGFSREGDSSQ